MLCHTEQSEVSIHSVIIRSFTYVQDDKSSGDILFWVNIYIITKSHSYFVRISSSLRASRFCINLPPMAAETVPVSSETTMAIAS